MAESGTDRNSVSGRGGGRNGDRRRGQNPRSGADDHEAFSGQDVEDIEERSRLRAPVIYEVVRREGEEEMKRPITSLWWSGLAAGLSISFSLLAQAILTLHLPDASWRPLVSALGYPIGFLMVVLARQQLFTENTITAVLPLAAEFTRANLWGLCRLWGIVLAANLAGTFVAAVFCSFAPAVTPELRDGMMEISRHMMASGWAEMFFKGISAGFLVAAMVWLIPSAEGTQFHVVVLLTYLIGIGDFTHVVTGSVQAFLLLVNGELGVAHMLLGFTLPVLFGNIVGGTALFALISYAQIMHEV
jgi:formate/nitrite transporter FocA (FNT family)